MFLAVCHASHFIGLAVPSWARPVLDADQSTQTQATINLPTVPESLKPTLRTWTIQYRDSSRPDQRWTTRRIPYNGQTTVMLPGITSGSIDVRAIAEYFGGASAESPTETVIVYQVPSTTMTIPTTTPLVLCSPLPSEPSTRIFYSDVGSNLIVGSQATVLCEVGYLSSGGPFTRLLCSDSGDWTGDRIECFCKFC